MTQAERRKLLERRKTLQTRKRIDGRKFSSSGQSELDRINKQLTQKPERRGKSIRSTANKVTGTPADKTVARTKATQANNAKKLSELEKQLKQLEDKKNVRPKKDQPFYHLLAENDEITYEAYVSEQNLLVDESQEPIKHPLINEIFSGKKGSSYFKLSN